MTLPLTLLTLRILSALILLLFLLALAWITYQDMRYSAKLVSSQHKNFSQIRVVSSARDEQLINVRFPLQSVMRIGRAVQNTIVLNDDFVSNEHLMIERREGQWWLTDLGSRNGTLLNDRRVEKPIIISNGDLITLGGTNLIFEQIFIDGQPEGNKQLSPSSQA